jgi:hypothetical protein
MRFLSLIVGGKNAQWFNGVRSSRSAEQAELIIQRFIVLWGNRSCPPFVSQTLLVWDTEGFQIKWRRMAIEGVHHPHS